MTPETIAKLARTALEREVLLTPKPGLVDAANSGAHRDMDKDTFLRSAAALEPWFLRMARAGRDLVPRSPSALLAGLRPLGLEAEADMYAATGGVNTHKGALFSLGLLCAAAGRLTAQGREVTPETLCDLAAQMTAGITARELQGRETHGLAAHARYGAKGVRGEAEAGFPSVRQLALPYLKQKDGAYLALLSLMAHVHDTNVLHRAGEEGLVWLQSRAKALLEDFSLRQLEQLDRDCIEKNISPGGCADLLAIAFFLEGVCPRLSPARSFAIPSEVEGS